MKIQKLFIDPPEGWKYGFPKEIPSYTKDHEKWLIENGYPKSLIDTLRTGSCRYWHEDVDESSSN